MRQSSLMYRSFLVAFVLIIGVAVQARAQVAATTTDDLTRQADVIAVGHVSSLVSEWNGDRTRIRTRVTVDVSDFVKGTGSGSTLTLFVPGGEVDGVGEMYSDMPVFRKDENVVVFAKRSVQGSYLVAGGTLGKYTIVKDAATGKEMVSSRLTVDEFTSQLRKAVATESLKQ